MEFPYWTHNSTSERAESVLHLSAKERIAINDESHNPQSNTVRLVWTTARKGKDQGRYTRIYHIYEPPASVDISAISPNGRVSRPDTGVLFEKMPEDIAIKQETVRKHLSVMYSKLSKHANLHPNSAELKRALDFIKKFGIFRKLV